MATQNWNWDERNQAKPIDFEGGVDEIRQGSTVVLEHNGVHINVQVGNNEGTTWTGVISGFPNTADQTEIGELEIGNTIKFEERHIFRCAA